MWRIAWTLALPLVLAACSLNDFLISHQSPAQGSEVTFSGTVVENVPACAYDADCYFTVQSDDATWTVIYGEGRRVPTPERPLCIENGEAGTVAFALVPGDEVRVSARVIDDHTVATCYSTEYAITLLAPSAAIGSEVTLTGVVVETIDTCVLDGICALVVDAEDGRYTVIYNVGEGECASSGALDPAIAIGDTVAIFAMVTGNAELSTCPSVQYTITRVE
jgi:hypothetical protein